MIIKFSQDLYDKALEEQRARAPYMLTKFENNAARKAGQIRGLVVEHHVAEWFKDNYQNNYLDADNYRQWTKPCSHDFKLDLGDKIINVDVTGPKKLGGFGSYPRKPKQGVDIHILCNPVGFKSWNNCDFEKGFEILGVVKSINYKQTINPKNIISFEVWLSRLNKYLNE